MRAMVLEELNTGAGSPAALQLRDLPRPVPGANELLLRITVCGVCHTELDEMAGRTPPRALPVVPGHQAVGMVEQLGPGASSFVRGDRVGVAWIYSACGECGYCGSGLENLCAHFTATGRDVNGGYAEFMRVPEAFAYPIPDELTDAEAAPLLCAGAVGFRALRLAGIEDGGSLGLSGFGSSGHIVLQLARHLFPRSGVFVFARQAEEREFALQLAANWAGDISEHPPVAMDAIIDTTPAWRPIIESLNNLAPGGRLVINAIRKEDADRDQLMRLSYADHLWMEREVKSVANVTRNDVTGILRVAAEIGLRPEVQEFPLEAANDALSEIRNRSIRGAKVLRISPDQPR